eukprot:GDKI01018981.1.p1 GENE.GDKI01018981.1~~GDKI01018981.1.p1  ORF type:complete len:116 (+),score=36.32 GDKI01018981.1:205-552(+)
MCVPHTHTNVCTNAHDEGAVRTINVHNTRTTNMHTKNTQTRTHAGSEKNQKAKMIDTHQHTFAHTHAQIDGLDAMKLEGRSTHTDTSKHNSHTHVHAQAHSSHLRTHMRTHSAMG